MFVGRGVASFGLPATILLTNCTRSGHQTEVSPGGYGTLPAGFAVLTAPQSLVWRGDWGLPATAWQSEVLRGAPRTLRHRTTGKQLPSEEPAVSEGTPSWAGAISAKDAEKGGWASRGGFSCQACCSERPRMGMREAAHATVQPRGS